MGMMPPSWRDIARERTGCTELTCVHHGRDNQVIRDEARQSIFSVPMVAQDFAPRVDTAAQIVKG